MLETYSLPWLLTALDFSGGDRTRFYDLYEFLAILPVFMCVIWVSSPGTFPIIKSYTGVSMHITSTSPIKYGLSTNNLAMGTSLEESSISAHHIVFSVLHIVVPINCFLETRSFLMTVPRTASSIPDHLDFNSSYSSF